MALKGFRRKRRPGNRGQTLEEESWVDRVKQAGCLCCLQLGFEHDPDGPMVEANHALSGGIRIGHLASYGLCLWHHRGRVTVLHWSLAMHRQELGPSLAEGSVPFHARFGSDADLLRQEAQLLGVPGDVVEG